MEITPLPHLDFFINGSTYTGSANTDPFTGCMNRTVFMYKISPKKQEESDTVLLVSYHLQKPWNADVINEELEEKLFEMTDDGKTDAEKWLNEKFNLLLGESENK